MVLAATEDPIVAIDSVEKRHSLTAIALVSAIAIAVAFGFVEVSVGATRAVPGSSILLPTIVVALIALACLGLGSLVVGMFRVRAATLVFVVVSSLIGFGATWWAYAFSWPAAMALDSHATSQALAALTVVPVNDTQCVNIMTGAIGPLKAPYQRCTTNSPHPGSVVFYDALVGGAVASPASGLVFNEGPVSDLSDQCVRHLVGDWYAFTSDPNGLAGYSQCNGGG